MDIDDILDQLEALKQDIRPKEKQVLNQIAGPISSDDQEPELSGSSPAAPAPNTSPSRIAQLGGAPARVEPTMGDVPPPGPAAPAPELSLVPKEPDSSSTAPAPGSAEPPSNVAQAEPKPKQDTSTITVPAAAPAVQVPADPNKKAAQDAIQKLTGKTVPVAEAELLARLRNKLSSLG